MTISVRRPSARLARGAHLARFVVALTLALAIAACGGTVVFDETDGGSGSGGADAIGATSGAGTTSAADTASASAGGGAMPLTCDLVEGTIELVPGKINPPECPLAMTCNVWFGHGQHLTCPRYTTDEPPFFTCDVWDCLCEIYEEDGFVANFATGEVVDARDPNAICRYTLHPSG